jgi:hypothetical protein
MKLEYSNEVVIRNFPANEQYMFFIAVYDKILDAWSEHSNYYEYEGQPIGLRTF